MWHPLQVPSPLGVPTAISPAAYPEYTAAYQCAAEDPRQRIWHVFDTNRLVPEYLVELRWTLQSGKLHVQVVMCAMTLRRVELPVLSSTGTAWCTGTHIPRGRPCWL